MRNIYKHISQIACALLILACGLGPVQKLWGQSCRTTWNVDVNDPITQDTTIHAVDSIKADTTISSSARVVFRAGESVFLREGFHVNSNNENLLAQGGATFTASQGTSANYIDLAWDIRPYYLNLPQSGMLDIRIQDTLSNIVLFSEQVDVADVVQAGKLAADTLRLYTGADKRVGYQLSVLANGQHITNPLIISGFTAPYRDPGFTLLNPIPFTLDFCTDAGILHIDSLHVVNGTITGADSIEMISSSQYKVHVTPDSSGRVALSMASNQLIDIYIDDNGKIDGNARDSIEVFYGQIPLKITSAADSTNQDPITFTLDFATGVDPVMNNHLDVTNGTINGNVQQDFDSLYTVVITPDDYGPVTVEITEGQVNGLNIVAGNAAAIDSVMYDNVPPNVTLISSVNQQVEDPIISIFIQFTELVTGFGPEDLDIENATVSDLRALTDSVYLADLIADNEGIISIQVQASVVHDPAGNPNTPTIEPLEIQYCKGIATNQVADDQLLLSGALPDELTGNPITEINTVSYWWEQTTNSENWTKILNAIGQDYAPPFNLSQSTAYRRQVWNGVVGCNANTSNEVYVCAFPEDNEIDPLQVIEEEQEPVDFEGSEVPGVVYQWQDSTAGQAWSDIPGASSTKKDYTPPVTGEITWYRRQVRDEQLSACVLNSNAVATLCITIVGNTISLGKQDTAYVASGYAVPAVSGSLPHRPVDAIFSYQWQDSTAGYTWRNIEDANERNYIPQALDGTTRYRRMVSTACDADTSNVVTFILDPLPVTDFDAPDSVCLDSPVSFTDNSTVPLGQVTGWRWHFGDGDSSLVQNPEHVFKKEGIHSVQLIASTSIGTQYATTKTIEILSLPANNIIENPDQLVNTGDSPEIFIGNDLGDDFSYQWQYLDNGGWEPLLDETDSTYLPRFSGTNALYRRKVTNDTTGCFSYSKTATLCVAIKGNTIGSNTQYVVSGSAPQPLTGLQPGEPTGAIFTYQWQDSTATRSWRDIGDATSREYSPTALFQTTRYRRIVNTTCDSDTSNVVEIEVDPAPEVEFTVDQPICEGGEVTFRNNSDMPAGIGYIKEYTWNFGDDMGISSEKDPTYTYAKEGDYAVTLTVLSNAGKTSTITDTITVNPLPENSIYSENTPGGLILRGNDLGDDVTYRWENSIDPTGQWVFVQEGPGNNYRDYKPDGDIQETTWYRRVATLQNGCFSVSNSEAWCYFPNGYNTISPDQNNGQKDDSEPFIGTDLGIGVAYQWEKSPDETNWTTIENAVGKDFTPIRPDQTTWFRRIATRTDLQCSIPSNTVILCIFKNADAGEDVTIRDGEEPALLQGSGGEGYEWRPITGLSDPAIANPEATPGKTTTYVVTVTDAYQCQASDSVTVTVIENTLVVQNVLTPGSNGENDTWKIENLDLFGPNVVKVFNRTGEEVYVAINYQNNWRGLHKNGKQLPDGVYYYVIELTKEGKTYKGVLTIMGD